jgi:hypothetical protein
MFEASSYLVESIYNLYRLDFLVHRTGNGLHYLSPTLITKERWKEIMERLKGVNPKCPMTTLRWLPNKYPNEPAIWFKSAAVGFDENIEFNCEEMCFLLNSTFKNGNFMGCWKRDLKFVHYPLPLGTNL